MKDEGKIGGKSPIMKSRIPIILAVLLGALHLIAIIGITIAYKGRGETQAFLMVYLDLPLLLVFQSFTADGWLLPILGTAMYAGIGYLLGRLIVWAMFAARKFKLQGR